MGTSVSLGGYFENFVKDQLATGRYNNASEVIRDGLRILEAHQRRLAVLDDGLARSRADVKAGRVTPADQVFDALEAEIAALPDTVAE